MKERRNASSSLPTTLIFSLIGRINYTPFRRTLRVCLPFFRSAHQPNQQRANEGLPSTERELKGDGSLPPLALSLCVPSSKGQLVFCRTEGDKVGAVEFDSVVVGAACTG